jgi:hypothetical protein
MPIFLVGIVIAMGGMANAQDLVTCGISSPPTLHATNTGHTEPIGAGSPGTPAGSPTTGNPTTAGGGYIRVSCRNTSTASAIDTGVVALTINVGSPITNSTSHPSSTTGVRLGNPQGVFGTTSTTGVVRVSIDTGGVSNSGGTVVIAVGTNPGPGQGTTFPAGSTGSFDLQGVLVSQNGKSGSLTASVTSTGGIAIGSPSGLSAAPTATTITDTLAGLKDPTVANTIPGSSVSSFFSGISGGPAVLNSAGGTVKGNFILRIEENYADMFRDFGQFNGGAVSPNSPASDTQVQIILSNIPSGLNISGCEVTMTNLAGTQVTSGTPTINFTNVTAAAPILTVNFNSAVDLDNVDVLWVKCASVSVGSATLPLPSTPVTAQVTLAPTGAALSSSGGVLNGLTTGQIPRYQQLLQPTSPVTLVVFPPSKTDLVMSFGFVGPGYNTGIAVANTTLDPFGTTGGGAAASSGTVTFLMVKNDGTTKTYTTTTGSPGAGLTGAGVVASGSTYVVNLSEILAAASFGSTFSGYVFITANFTHAHGAATIYTTSTGAAALSTPVLVLQSGGSGISSANPRSSPESLGQ